MAAVTAIRARLSRSRELVDTSRVEGGSVPKKCKNTPIAAWNRNEGYDMGDRKVRNETPRGFTVTEHFLPGHQSKPTGVTNLSLILWRSARIRSTAHVQASCLGSEFGTRDRSHRSSLNVTSFARVDLHSTLSNRSNPKRWRTAASSRVGVFGGVCGGRSGGAPGVVAELALEAVGHVGDRLAVGRGEARDGREECGRARVGGRLEVVVELGGARPHSDRS